MSSTDQLSPLGSVKMGPVVGQYGMDRVRDRFDEAQQEVCCDPPCRLLMQLGEGELGGPIDGDEQIEPALGGADFGDVDVEVADRIELELAP